MEYFELLEHTADIRILAKGDNRRSLFTAALKGLCEVMKPGYKDVSDESGPGYEFKLDSVDISALLIDFLAEALSIMQTYNVLLPGVKFENIDNHSVSGKFQGFPVRAFDEDVKAVTYHEAEVVRNDKNDFEAIIVLDL